MKYKLYTENKYDSTIAQILHGRGMNDTDIQKWLSVKMSDVSSYDDLKNIDAAVALLKDTIFANENALIVVDCDVDGYTSAAILINYLYHFYPEWTKSHLTYIHHSGKQHGLSDIEVPENINLVICPDSASNDYEYHEKLCDRKIGIIILDHHEAPYESECPNVITVNNQLCDYKNKDFSGAGIVWQFCRAFDSTLNENYADELLDLCALGNCGDMMSYKSPETKIVIDTGFENIRNPFFYSMVEKNKFSIETKKGGINYMSIAFYVVPFINATVRSGTTEEKELIFKSMCVPYAFEKIPSGKRGEKGKMVPLYEEAVRIVSNIKKRQTDLQNESMFLLENKIKNENLLNNAILVLCCEPGEVEKNIAGLCANKIQAKYQRPTLVLTKSWESGDSEYYFRGSARNYSMSEIQNFKDKIEESGYAEYAQGHQGAFGCSIAEKDLDNFISHMNNDYIDVSKEPIYWVDYIWNDNEVDNGKILEIADLKIWGQEIPESKIAIKDIDLSQCNISLMSPDKNPTLKITLPCGLSLIKFKSSEEEFEDFSAAHKVLTAIISPNKNEWMGKVSAQGMIEEFELRKQWVF